MGEDGGGGGSGGGGGGGSGMSVRRMQERENLRHIIQQWNANRLDLFEISEPNEDLEFHGVMRFYFQDSGQKVATKCIRVMSSANSRAVIETLVEKFRPDMRMLSIPEYALYEIHENGDERRLAEDEKPLLVQLNWNKDDREGRFLLRRMDLYNLSGIPSEGNPAVVHTLPPHPTTPVPTREQPFTRKLSKREKKELKKAEKMRRANETNEADTSVAEKLYTELPETSFTRSISNPEAVMRRRRAQKLEKKLQQFRSKDGGPDTGGTLKIYGESLRPDVPYKTLLLSIRDNAHSVVREMLEKYGLYKEDPNNYCLVQTVAGNDEAYGGMSPQKEYILDDDECPLAILMNHHPSRGSIMFHVRRRPADYGPRKRKKKPVKGSGGSGGLGGDAHDHSRPHHPHFLPDRLPFLIELGPDGNELGGYGRQHQLHLNVTEVGTDRSTHTGGQSLQLFGPNIQPRHCVIAHTEGIVTVTPCSRDADTFVNGQRIYETTILQHGCVVRFGRIHNFRFVDPLQDDRVRQHQPMDKSGQEKAATGGPGEKMEAGGDTVSHAGSHSGSQAGSRNSRSSGHERPNRADQSFEGSYRTNRRHVMGNYERYPPARDPILPAVLEFREESEDAFLHTITTDLDPTDVQFKLAPTYTLYMAARFRASTHYRPDLSPTERAHRLTEMLTKVAAMVQNVIHSRHGDPTSLAFWMANASELLHFLKQDRHICGYSLDAQDILAEAVQVAFRSLVECMETELSTSLPMFLEDRDDINEEEGSTAHVLSILSNTMALLRRCRVNAALTIQLFSQLFHFINMWVFNRIVADSHTNYCTRIWGIRLKRRLARIELWAEKQGLELAADCHLARLSQAAMLLHSQKSSADDIATISSTCFKLNSLQLRALLEKYQTASDEPRIPQDLIDNVVAVAESTADGLAREDGREVKLKEEIDLQLPFLLPEDGYSCDIVRGVPSGLAEFLTPLQHAGLCRMNPQPSSSGYWTIYMHEQDVRVPPGPRSPSVMSNRSMSIPRGEPEIHVIQLQKSNNGMGLSIVATKGVNQDKLGIYIKSVVPGGAADQDGRLQAGDQLLTVDGKSLIGITQERAAEYMMETGPVVTLEVARQGAIYHGLATILSQPSPQANRASLRKMRPRAEEATRAAMTNSQSTPNMGGYNERLVDWNQPPRQHPLPPTTSHNSLLARSSPNLAAAAEGYPGGRHLSERDLPSKVLREHSQDPPTHPHQAPRMQSSKSVPSLNSDGGSSVVGGKAASLEVFNPSYSRTSSNTSLSQPPTSHVSHHQHHMQQQQHHQQQQQPPVRSRSIQNLSDGSYQGAVGRHPSNPSLVVEEERYYQNVNFHQGPQDPRMGSTRTRPAQPLPLGSPTSQGPTEQVRSDHIRPDPRGDHRPASAFMQREDMMSHRNDLQRPASQRDIRADAKMMEMTEEVRRREERMRLNGHSGNPQQQRPGPHQPHHRVPNAYPANSPFSADGYGGLQGFPSQQHSGYHPASSQTLSPQGPISGLQVPPQHHPHSQYPPGQPHGFPGKHPPPTAPKPKSQGLSQTPLSPEAPEKPSRQFGYDGIGPGYEGGPPRPPPPEDGYRDSPPPPPPPTSTHPLLQGSRPTSSVGYSSNQLPNKAAFNAASPWDREEKDRNDRRRREAVRHWRDEQISSLEALEVRTSQQDERLRTLRLEKEFQRRAEEALTNEDDDDEDEDDDEADDPNENENKDSSRQTLEPLIKEDSKPLSSVTQEPRMNGGGPVDDERARRVDEIRRKQQELEAASEVEERLLREAQRRQQEEQMRQKQQQAAPSQHLHYQHQHHASQRLDSLVATPFQPQYSNGPVNGMRGGGSHASYQEHGVGPDIRNRGESVVSVAQNSPVPPERGSSYSVMQQQTPTSASSNSRYKGTDTSSATIKRVQFSETPATVETHITYDSNANQEKTPQDPNLPRPFYKNFINEAETLLNSSPTRSIIGTPGVIGAQEVYRDPRMRRLQQKQAEQAAAKNPGPEKLTFKEKMKMFAMETGEGETPKDKVKISRAQRDIEH
ncbi:afadin-like isoform X5 [Macrobrachium nipponense]|uniref:afadin-like isoform X5 n=1 Tax=Macrobrachium nipponense TaxID=159736 RepID=UPI0030C801B5